MFKSYISREDFIDFKKDLLDRTRSYFNSILENYSSQIHDTEHEYFYTFLLPILIELDYFHYVSARKIYKNSKSLSCIKAEIRSWLKIILLKVRSKRKNINNQFLFDDFFFK